MKLFNHFAVCTALSCLVVLPSFAQQAPTGAPSTVPAANPADVATMDAILAAMYDVISGPAKVPRNWDRMRSLFIPGARLIPTGARPGGEVLANVRDLEGYIATATQTFDKIGFFETEAARRVEQFGHIAHVFSTYETRHAKEEAKPFQRGINSIQLLYDNKRWWIVTIYWEGERADNPIPETYLRSK